MLTPVRNFNQLEIPHLIAILLAVAFFPENDFPHKFVESNYAAINPPKTPYMIMFINVICL
jgi:hypothetical protein